MKRMLCLFLAIVLLVAAGSSVAFASSTPAKTTIEVVMPKPEIREAVQKTMDRYNQEVLAGTGITLQFEVFADSYDDYLKTRFASGNMVDIFFREPYSQLLYWSDYVEPLTDQPWVADLDEAAKDGYVWGGELYAMPLGYEAVGMWYHKDILKQMGRDTFPQTWDELVAYSDELVAAGIQPTRNTFNSINDIVNVFQTAFYFNDLPCDETFVAVAKDQVRLADLPGFKYFTQWLDFSVKYGAKDREDAVGIDQEKKSKFTSKKLAFLAEGVWQEPTFAASGDTANLGFTALPYSNDAEANKLPTAVPMGFIVYKDSPVKEEAKKFLAWFHDQGTTELVDSWNITPCWKSMAAATEGKLNISNTAAFQYVQNDKVVPWVKFYYPMEGRDDILGAVQAYVLGECSAEEMADEIQGSIMANFKDFPSKT